MHMHPPKAQSNCNHTRDVFSNKKRMKKQQQFYITVMLFALLISCKETDQPKYNPKLIENQSSDVISTNRKVDTIFAVNAPNRITRTAIQDKDGNIWFASFEGIIRYDGKSFVNITHKINSNRFFSVLQDRKGNFWFASIGSGVYYYNGKSFQNFTTKEGLANDRVICIYEDKTGKIWFGTEGGVSCYDGKSFRNFTTKEGLPKSEVSSIIEDHTGKFWIGTRYGVYIYDGKALTAFNNKDGKPFKNVRSIIVDKKGNIWVGGSDGLWRYDGNTFINFTQKFVGYIYEDRKGNIWTSSSESTSSDGWALSCYDEKNISFANEKALVTEIKTNEKMLFGILEDKERNIWVGTIQGVFKYDGKSRVYFRNSM